MLPLGLDGWRFAVQSVPGRSVRTRTWTAVLVLAVLAAFCPWAPAPSASSCSCAEHAAGSCCCVHHNAEAGSSCGRSSSCKGRAPVSVLLPVESFEALLATAPRLTWAPPHSILGRVCPRELRAQATPLPPDRPPRGVS